MADAPVVHIGENSPEQIAYKLLKAIAASEGKGFEVYQSGVSRKYILGTYAECLQAVRDPVHRTP